VTPRARGSIASSRLTGTDDGQLRCEFKRREVVPEARSSSNERDRLSTLKSLPSGI
jgi:hypothetical protein